MNASDRPSWDRPGWDRVHTRLVLYTISQPIYLLPSPKELLEAFRDAIKGPNPVLTPISCY